MRVITPTPDIEIRTVQDSVDLAQFTGWLLDRPDEVLGLDAETNGVDPFDPGCLLRAVQIADPHVSWVLPAERIPAEELARVISAHGNYVAHFSENDIRFCHRGAPGSIKVTEDRPHVVDLQTVLAWYDPRTVTSQDDAYGKIPLPRGLKPTVERVLGTDLLENAKRALHTHFHELAAGRGMRKKDEIISYGFGAVDFDDPRYQLYSGLDPLYEVRLWHVMTAEVRRRGQWPGLSDDLALQWWIDCMTLRGMPSDGPYAQWLDGQFEAAIAEHAAALAYWGIGPSGMGPAVGGALEHLGAVPRYTKRADGERVPSWDKFALADIMTKQADSAPEAAALARKVVAVRKASKFRSTYVKPMLVAATRDGRLHPSMRAVGAITSRQSAANPPVQQLPKKDPRVRAAIVAPPGWSLVSCDLAQGEPRTMAGLSGDKNLLAAIQSGDLNSTITAAVYGDQYDQAHGQDAGTPHYLMRQGGKAGFLAWCYGAQDKKLAETLAKDQAPGVVPITTAPSEQWRRDFPDLGRTQDDLNNRRFVTLPNGWIVPLWDRARYDETTGRIVDTGRPSRKGLNAATQGTQRQLLAAAVRRLVGNGWGWALLMFVHDEILLLVPSWMAEQARDALKDAMTMVFRGVPIECEAQICGATWLPRPAEFAADTDALLALADEAEVAM